MGIVRVSASVSLDGFSAGPDTSDANPDFTFVTDGIASAVEQARAAAGDRDVLVMDGAVVSQQVIAAGMADELLLNLVPVLLHRGERLLDHVGGGLTHLERTEVVATPRATHLRYRFLR